MTAPAYGIPQVKARGHDSTLWKAICKVWPRVTEGVGWSIGNGTGVKFWADNWLELGRLWSFTSACFSRRHG